MAKQESAEATSINAVDNSAITLVQSRNDKNADNLREQAATALE